MSNLYKGNDFYSYFCSVGRRCRLKLKGQENDRKRVCFVHRIGCRRICCGGGLALPAGRSGGMRGRTERGLRAKADNEAKNARVECDLNRQAAERAARCAGPRGETCSISRPKRERERARRTEEIAALQEQQRLAFKNLANDILEEKSRQFKQSNRESLESLLKPFRENIEGFRKRVDEVYDKEKRSSVFRSKEEIRSLNEMNRRMSEEANNLTRALKGNSKVQGDWGEMILETILDSSHLVKGIHYFTQENLKDAAGQQPASGRDPEPARPQADRRRLESVADGLCRLYRKRRCRTKRRAR